MPRTRDARFRWQSRPGLEAEREPARRNILMDVSKILGELKAEREQIEEAIISLERLARGRGRGPGRPPNWVSEIPPKGGGRPRGKKKKVPPPAPTSLAAPRGH